jgi:hypothetical protein
MPPIFKALASITVWILFIVGCLMILFALPIPFWNRGGSGYSWLVGIASLFLSAVTMKIRKSID